MGYTICYDRRFIKSASGITPLWLAGSSNVYDPLTDRRGRCYERRARSWGPLFNLAGVSPELLLEKARSYVPSTYQEHFEYHGKWVDDAAFLRFFENGIKSACTIEDLLEAVGWKSFRFKLSVWPGDNSAMCKDELSEDIKSTQDLDAWIKKANERMANRKEKEDVFIVADLRTVEPIRMASQPAVSGKVIAKVGRSDYISAADPITFSYCGDPDKALVFDSIEAARAALPDWAIRVNGIRFVKAESVLARRAWKYAVRVASGYHKGLYVMKGIANGVRYTTQARDCRKFPTLKAAEKYTAQLNARKWQNPVTFEAINIEEEK